MFVMFFVLGCVVAMDQASKAVVAARLGEGTATRGALGGVRLRHVVNRGRMWKSSAGVLGLTLAWMVFVAAGAAIATVVQVTWVSVALGVSLGGATGNLIDGIRRRAVIDFVDLRVWPVFNLADAAIVAGALIAACKAL
jgi:signal peptidase II